MRGQGPSGNSKSGGADPDVRSAEVPAGRGPRGPLPAGVHRTNATRSPVHPRHGQEDDVGDPPLPQSASSFAQDPPGSVPFAGRGRRHDRRKHPATSSSSGIAIHANC